MASYKALKDITLYPPGREKPGQAGWVAERLLRLRRALDAEIRTNRRANSLIIGSWNIRHFDGGRPRLPESFHYIAEIIDHFDVCALQEVKSKASVDYLMSHLGPNWDYFINDSSGGGRGNHERMAFLYNRNRVTFRNLIGELVVSKDALPGGEQVGRTPFFAAFQAGWFRFTMCAAHIVFKEEVGRPLRKDEIGVIARELAKRAKDTGEVHVFIGDMNIEAREDDAFEAMIGAGFHAPDFGGTSVTGTKHYDHIAFHSLQAKTQELSRGTFQMFEHVFREDEADHYEEIAAAIRREKRANEGYWQFHLETKAALKAGEAIGSPYTNWAREYSSWRTHEMSDHLPIWIELEVDYSDEYLEGIAGG
ncbi:MAG: endonuclease/exonuclease/phosphatase family protein [Pseudomonadota bacterium]